MPNMQKREWSRGHFSLPIGHKNHKPFSMNFIEFGNYEISDGNTMVTFQFYTDYGQDVNQEIELEDWNDTEEICDKLKKLYENFDVDYETYIWIGEDGHGKNGAPYHIQDILNDMEIAEKKLGELYEEFMLKC